MQAHAGSHTPGHPFPQPPHLARVPARHAGPEYLDLVPHRLLAARRGGVGGVGRGAGRRVGEPLEARARQAHPLLLVLHLPLLALQVAHQVLPGGGVVLRNHGLGPVAQLGAPHRHLAGRAGAAGGAGGAESAASSSRQGRRHAAQPRQHQRQQQHALVQRGAAAPGAPPPPCPPPQFCSPPGRPPRRRRRRRGRPTRCAAASGCRRCRPTAWSRPAVGRTTPAAGRGAAATPRGCPPRLPPPTGGS